RFEEVGTKPCHDRNFTKYLCLHPPGIPGCVEDDNRWYPDQHVATRTQLHYNTKVAVCGRDWLMKPGTKAYREAFHRMREQVRRYFGEYEEHGKRCFILMHGSKPIGCVFVKLDSDSPIPRLRFLVFDRSLMTN
ncbi:hypothetical protein AAVH_40631, partial [Aphelenchoides avenae]